MFTNGSASGVLALLMRPLMGCAGTAAAHTTKRKTNNRIALTGGHRKGLQIDWTYSEIKRPVMQSAAKHLAWDSNQTRCTDWITTVREMLRCALHDRF